MFARLKKKRKKKVLHLTLEDKLTVHNPIKDEENDDVLLSYLFG